jgi:hypothetical protein
MPASPMPGSTENARGHGQQAGDIQGGQEWISAHRVTAFARPPAPQDEQGRGHRRDGERIGKDDVVEQLLERAEHERGHEHGRGEEREPGILNLGAGIDPQKGARQHAVLGHRVIAAGHLQNRCVDEAGCGQKDRDRDQRLAAGTKGCARERGGSEIRAGDAADAERTLIADVEQQVERDHDQHPARDRRRKASLGILQIGTEIHG